MTTIGNAATTVFDYCKSGGALITNHCNIVNPINSDKFRQFCCNNTTDPAQCNDISASCAINTSKFLAQEPTMTNLNLLVDVTVPVTSFCQLGLDLKQTACSSTNYMTANFIKYCCNGVADSTKCSMDAANCFININKLTRQVNTFSAANIPTDIATMRGNTSVGVVGYVPMIQDYCNTLNKVQQSGCTYSSGLTKYNSLCPIVSCIPSLATFEQNTDYMLLKSQTFRTTNNSSLVCNPGKNIITTCPSLIDVVKGYAGGYYSTYCPQ